MSMLLEQREEKKALIEKKLWMINDDTDELYTPHQSDTSPSIPIISSW